VGNSTGGYTLTATSSLGLGSISAIGPTGQTSSGPTVTFATSTGSFNGLTTALTITGSGNTQTFTPSISGTLTVAGGGTGQTSLTSGQLIYGAGTAAVQSVATSTFAVSGPFTTSGTIGFMVGGTNSTVTYTGLATTTALSASGVLYSTNGAAGVSSAATSTPTAVDLTISGTGATIGSLTILNPYAIATTSGITPGGLAYYTNASGKTTIGNVSTTTFTPSASFLLIKFYFSPKSIGNITVYRSFLRNELSTFTSTTAGRGVSLPFLFACTRSSSCSDLNRLLSIVVSYRRMLSILSLLNIFFMFCRFCCSSS
jgi:hypothetical protein